MDKKIMVKGRAIGQGEPIFITAEIGVAHQGDLTAARELLLGAAKAGCDGADFFLAQPDDFYAAHEPEPMARWNRYMFAPSAWQELMAYADSLGIIMYLTPLDAPSVALAARLGCPMLNINSDVVNDLQTLEAVARTGLPVSMHDVGITLSEIEAAVQVLNDHGCRDIILLHSTLEAGAGEDAYTTANLRVMDTYRSAFTHKGVLVGCVEHTSSDFLIYGVAAREAVMISKHILVRHAESTPDNRISVELANLQTMVHNVRMIQAALGGGTNCMVVDKQGRMNEFAAKRRKILVASRDIPAGTVIDDQDVRAARSWVPGGLHPWTLRQIRGATAAGAIAKDTPLSLNMLRDFPPADYKFPRIDGFVVRRPNES